MTDYRQRKSIRLQGYDYSQSGAYYVTICVENRIPLLGQVQGDETIMSPYGQIAHNCWLKIAEVNPAVELDAFVLMPNHLHGILVLSPELKQEAKPLGRILGHFKRASTIQINRLREKSGINVWQRDFHDRIIRDEEELNIKRQYITTNPARWAEDEYHK